MQGGGPDFALTVNGTNFVSNSVVRWNGADRTTTYVNPGRLKAAILAADIAAVGTASVTVFNPAGEKIEHIDVQEPWTANVCFGGKDRKTLFITASKSLYSTQMAVHGVDSQ